MNILHIIPSLKIGGAERLVVDICNELSNKKNCTVRLITFSDDFDSIDLRKSYHKHIPSFYRPSITSNSAINVGNLQKEIDEFNPDIIHSHLWEAEILLTQVKVHNVIRFSHFHDNMAQLRKISLPNSKIKITDFFERNIFLKSNSNNFICISKDTLSYANKVLPKKNRKNIHLLENAIHYENFHSLKKKNIDTINLINMGSFVPKKNQKLSVTILNELINKGYQANLIFLGDGPNINDIVAYAKELKIENFIEFKGNVTDVKPYLEQSNLYLHTAYYEPFGLVIIEAMAAGLPVVTLDGLGNRDFIEHGDNGYIFKSQDPETFANCIIDLFNNEKLYLKNQKNGYTTAKKYDIKEYINKLIEIYTNSLQ